MSLRVPRDQPEKEREGEGERKRESTRERPSLCKNPITLFLKGVLYPKFYIIENTESCRGSSPDPFCISFCIQKVSGDLHYLLAKRPVNALWLSSLMDVNLIPPEVFSFNLHLLKALNEAASL